jgi:predicted ferric reductase
MDTVLQFHREAGIVAVVFALLHPTIILITAPAYIEYLDPRVNAGRAIALMVVVIAMVLILLLTFKRKRYGIPYEWWRFTHGLLGVLVVLIAVMHILQVEWYVAEPWLRAVWISLTAAAVLLLGHVRIGKPLQMQKHPYRITEVRPEGPRTWTIALEPTGHRGMKFKPGQFAWLTVGETPFSMQQNPFSISSSALEEHRIEFTIRELGDFTSTIGKIRPGTTAFVEGPYGAFVPDFRQTRGLVLVAGGVGIAPMMSMLRTMCDQGERRPVYLIYGAYSPDDLVFRDELESLKNRLVLQPVFVVETESGRINDEILEKYLPDDRKAYDYFICGPQPMMDLVEANLNRSGVPPGQIHSERFDIA